jgi:hypothetical protein
VSIPRRHPIVEVGDAGAVGSSCFAAGNYSAWRVDGLRDEVSDRGALYPSFANAGAGLVDIRIYSDRERTVLVAEGLAQPITARVVASPTGTPSSRLTVSCMANSDQATAAVTIWVQLATLADIEEREDDAGAFFRGSAAICSYDVIGRACMRQLYLNVQALFPPPQRAGAPLSLHGTSSVQIAGRRGLPDLDAPAFWSLNGEGDWELVGLQNVSDFKEWAIAWSLGLIWKRRAGSADDPMLRRSQLYFEEARDQWVLLPYLVDMDRDGTPEREVRRSPRVISRG